MCNKKNTVVDSRTLQANKILQANLLISKKCKCYLRFIFSQYIFKFPTQVVQTSYPKESNKAIQRSMILEHKMAAKNMTAAIPTQNYSKPNPSYRIIYSLSNLYVPS